MRIVPLKKMITLCKRQVEPQRTRRTYGCKYQVVAVYADCIIIHKGPPSIKSKNVRKDAWGDVDITGGDVGGYARRAQEAVEAKIKLPPDYRIFWSGQSKPYRLGRR